jgi:hypothetical protein
MPTNQGRDIDGVISAVSWRDIDESAQVMWSEVRRHPAQSYCVCPVVEVIARLQELGYTIHKETEGKKTDEDSRRV